MVAGASPSAQAGIFKCTDAAGKQAFSDQPCEGAKRETVELKYRGVAVQPPDSTLSPSAAAAVAAATAAASAAAAAAASPPPSPKSPTAAAPAPVVKAPEIPLPDRLAALCVDVYRAHLAYPQGVRIVGRTLEKSLSEYLITVQVKTISNPATPAIIDPIVIDEKFICVTDGGAGLNARSTDMYVQRHKSGQRL